MSRLFAAILIAVAVINPAAAQFSIPGLSGSSEKSDNAGSPDLATSQDHIVRQYVGAGKHVLAGSSKMAEAVGLKKESAAARAAGDSLGDGATKGSLSDADKTSSETNEAVAAALKNTDQMDATSKKKFADGMVSLAQGLAKYIAMRGSFNSFQKSLSGASPMMLPKLQAGSYIVTSFPSNVKNLSSALQNAMAFAKSHDIAVPKDATDVMSKV
jgi:hypothetical protein